MPDPTEGGLRDRLVFESAHRHLRHFLAQLGWFNTVTLAPGVKPITLATEPVAAADKIEPNLITITTGPMDPSPAETGSGLTENLTELWVTIYAQNDSLGRHLQGDCYGILAGQMASIGAVDAGFNVYDWRAAPAAPDYTYPPVDREDPPEMLEPLFRVAFEDLATDREHDPRSGVERDTWYVVGQMDEYRS